MDGPRRRRMLVVLVAVLVAGGAWVWVRSASSVQLTSNAVLSIDTSHPGSLFERGAVGLSVETSELNSGRLSAGQTSLVRLLRLLGPSVLRIGGNSVDFSWWTSGNEAPPSWATSTITPADLVALRGLLAATGWRVLLGVDLGHFEPPRAADEARYARKILGARLLGIEIGNEPNAYSTASNEVALRPATYGVGQYLREVEAYRQSVSATAPSVPIYGSALSRTRWLTEMGASASIFAGITQHYYPTVTCPAQPASPATQQPTVSELLSPALREQENETLSALTQAGATARRSIWLDETGTGTCRGKSSSGPTFASALWALDWGLRAASSGVQALNFHGHLGLCGPYAQSSICAPTATAAKARDLTPQPEYYGLLAASLLEGGRFVPTRMLAAGPLANLTTWATLAVDGTVRVAIDELATAGPTQPVSIHMPGYTATEKSLVGPSPEATSGVTLGRTSVNAYSRWRPRPVTLRRSDGAFRVTVHPASAVIITLRPTRLHH